VDRSRRRFVDYTQLLNEIDMIPLEPSYTVLLIILPTVYMTVAGARRFQGIRPQSLYIKDQPSWPIYVSNCIYETYDLGNY